MELRTEIDVYGFDIIVHGEKSKKEGVGPTLATGAEASEFDYALSGGGRRSQIVQNRFYLEVTADYLYSFNNGILGTDPHTAAQNFINALDTIEPLLEKHSGDLEKMTADIPVLKEMAKGTWRKEDDLAALKDEIKELDGRIQKSLTPIAAIEGGINSAPTTHPGKRRRTDDKPRAKPNLFKICRGAKEEKTAIAGLTTTGTGKRIPWPVNRRIPPGSTYPPYCGRSPTLRVVASSSAVYRAINHHALKYMGLVRGINSSFRVALQPASPPLGVEGGDEERTNRQKKQKIIETKVAAIKLRGFNN